MSLWSPRRAAPSSASPGRLLAVWSPGGSPGCSTVAAGLAAVIARLAPVILVDGDLTRGGLTLLLNTAPGRTLGSALLLPRRADEPCAPGHLQETAWGARVLPGVPGPGALLTLDPEEYRALLIRLRAAADLVIVDVGDELPPRDGGALHAAALGLADGVVVVGAATEPGEHDLLLEYRLLHELLAMQNPTARRWAVLNHMPEGRMTYWSRLLRSELDLALASQLPHDWGAASRARQRRLPLPVADRHSAAAVALERVGARLADALLTVP